MKTLCVLLVIWLPACVSGIETKEDQSVWGSRRPSTHEVSVAELLGRPDFFDGEPVRVVGVAQFDLGFEGRSSLYLSEADAKFETASRVDIEFGNRPESLKLQLVSLTGHFVIVEGVFYSNRREKLRNDQRLRVCVPACPAAGTIKEVNNAVQLEPLDGEG